MSVYFTLIWITIIAVGIFLYVVLDGFDLGVGILSRNAPSPNTDPRRIGLCGALIVLCNAPSQRSVFE